MSLGSLQICRSILLLTSLSAGLNSFVSADDQVDFNREIRPILSDMCYKCHGPDAAERKAGLRLDGHAGATAKLESGFTAIVAGKPEDSHLIARITTSDPDLMMPPPETERKLTAAQVELLTRWIQQGGEYKGHWSFIRPERLALPAISQENWAANPIDRFVMAKLDKSGLKPSPEADRYNLIRRVTLDLTGLPPTPEEVDAFVNDSDPNAYEKLVDRLLASGRYGEQMTRYWLDLVRYGDSHGLHLDNERALWKYRCVQCQ